MNKIILKKCPIVESTINILCDYTLPVDAIVGVIYQLLSDQLKDIQLIQEPICKIPYDLRKNDPNLKDKATHRVVTKDGQILIGEHTISIVSNIPYVSWEESSKFVYFVIDLLKIEQGNIIKEVKSISIKYLNFFINVNIFDKINLSINLNNASINYPATIIKTEIPSVDKKTVSVLQIANSVHIKNDFLKLDNDGSLIDLTVAVKELGESSIKIIIERLHNEEEDLFFSLLSSDFVNELK